MKLLKFLLICVGFAGCYQVYTDDDDEELNTIPVTNNPYVTPHSSVVRSSFGPERGH